jgi:Transposase DDE domain group 1
VASDPVASRLVTALAADAPRALRVIRKARAAARQRAWALAGERAPGADGSLIPVDTDATIVIAHSEKENAAATWKKTFGFHPLAVFADHGACGAGEALGIMLRPGNAGSNTAAKHIEAARLALAQLPRRLRRQALIRTDCGGGTHEFLAWLASPGRRLHYSVGMTITEDVAEAILRLPDRVWEPAYDADGQARPGAWVAEITGMMDLAGWPEGMRVIVRKERPTPAPSCGSPTSTGTASPASPPTPHAGSWLTWSCVTAAGPAARTASAPPRTPGCATCPCTASPRTRSGASLSQWPAN